MSDDVLFGGKSAGEHFVDAAKKQTEGDSGGAVVELVQGLAKGAWSIVKLLTTS